MPIPASIIVQLRALNSGHTIQSANGQTGILVDGNNVSLTTILAVASGGTATAANWTKDQFEGFNMLTAAQQTALITNINTLVSAQLSSGSATQVATLAAMAAAAFDDTSVDYEARTVQTPDNSYTFRPGGAIVGQQASNLLVQSGGAGNVPINLLSADIATVNALSAGTVTAAQVLGVVQLPS